MSAFSPTRDQAAAIAHPLADACVIAGAGSGKTAVLTRRYLELVLEHGLSARRVAALTFTEKAAAQMRERIGQVLADSGHPGLRDDVEVAPISTIHAFCARLLRLHAIEAGLDPAFAVLDETEAKLLLEDAWTRTLERLGAEGSSDLGVLAEVGATPDDLRSLLERVRGAGADVEALAWHAAEMDLAAAQADGERACTDLEQESQSGDAALLARVAATVRDVREALAAKGGERAWLLAAALALVKRLTQVPRPVVKARKDLENVLAPLVGGALDDAGRTEIAGPLVRLLTAVAADYAELKHERGALDFTDLERSALALLESLAASGRRLARAPQALLVDEYQDTNPLQAKILDRLRTASCPLFSVGDPKQSIYRFRRADVTVIQREHERVGEEGRHLLRATFRARPALVDGLNHLHAALFANGAAGVEHVELRAEGSFHDAEGPDVEFALVDAGGGTSALARREAEARWIAAWIRDFVARQIPRAKVERDENGDVIEARVLGYGDIAILFRARSSLSIYEAALQAADIPFHTHKGRGFFQADEVVDLLHALRVVHDPADDHAFACFATGPALAATDADLLRFFPGREEGLRRAGAAWERFVADAEGEGGTVRMRHVARTVEALRREARLGRLGRVVEGVLRDLGLLEVALLQPDGLRRAANLRKAVTVARDLERSGREDLHDLLRHLSLLRDREVAESEAALGRAGEEVVVLNTIHGAKGLEYPVVILADTGRKPPQTAESVGYDGGRGFATMLVHPLEGSRSTPGGLARLREEEKEKAEEESLRLLYVATTRAEERLLITGACSGFTKKPVKPKDYVGWGPWLLEALGGTPPPGGAEVEAGRSRMRVALVEAPAPPARRHVPSRERGASAAAVSEAERVLTAARRGVATLGDTPYVVTVTELLDFAASPRAAYLRRLEPGVAGRAPLLAHRESEDPASGSESTDPEAGRREDRRRLHDEGEGVVAGVDRAALGRALHALLEGLPPGAEGPDPAALTRVLEAEALGPRSGSVAQMLTRMVARFARSETGRHLDEALAREADVRREMAFHARIRFPAGLRVGAFDALLVRGSIDLWLPGPDGIWIVDHKTNPRSEWLPSPEAVGRHYAWQLRLYALAAERVLGEDVAGAKLLLLDESWGDDAVEVAVDVSGPALEDARRLCRAYAVAELEGRWPSDWHDLLEA